MSIRKGDFVEISYNGFIDGEIFDTTDEAEAKKAGMWRANFPYGQVRIKVGSGHVLKGLDDELVGKEVGKNYDVKLKPENAFGKKSAQMIKMVPLSKFTRDNVNPQPGMIVNVDGVMATIKRVGGGRVLVDFNHPLADKEIHYKFKIEKKLTEAKEVIESILAADLDLIQGQYDLKVEGDNAEIKIKEEREFDRDMLISKIKENTKLKKVELL